MLGNFKFKLNANVWRSERKILEVLSLTRKLQTIEIADAVGCHDVLMKVIRILGPTLRNLTLSDSKIDDFTLREILRAAHSLENLILIEVSIVKKLPAINPVSMRKLKSLTINHCDWNIIQFIKAQVTKFDVKSYLDEGLKYNLVQFLESQFMLKELKLRGTSVRLLFQQDDIIANCKFSLEKFLAEHGFGKNSDNVNWHLTAFLSLHIETLKEIEVSGPHSEYINGFIIANLVNLENLAIDVRGLPKNEEFYELILLEPNAKLKELSLRGFFVQPELIKKILKRYPAIEKLELNDWGNGTVVSDMLAFLADNFSRLMNLSITEVTKNEGVRFTALKRLAVSYIRNTGKLMQFIMHNSSVETVNVGIIYVGQITSSFVEDLKQIEHVKHIAFGGNPKSLSLILEMMKRNPTRSLKTLELSMTSDDRPVSKKKALKLYFPISENVNLI